MENVSFTPFYRHEHNVYHLEGFHPAIIDADYLKNLGVSVCPSEDTLERLKRGSILFAQRLREKNLVPKNTFRIEQTDPIAVKTEIHNYTGRCPTLTYEINPVRGCTVGCLYCLVTDGVHEQPLVALDNYHLYVRQLLEEHNGRGSKNDNHYFYFSPKTEAFQEATLLPGIAHRILQEFIRHYQENPASQARLFIASKAGTKHLLYEHEGMSILDLFEQLKGKMQFNTSVSIMAKAMRDLIEPSAAPIEERLKAVKLCQQRGVQANSALVQPILTPYLTDEHIKQFFDALNETGIINYKPEFLTACMENLAMLGQYLAYFDKSLEKQLYDDYLRPSNTDHKKQRGRTAPDRDTSIRYIRKMMQYTETLGMSTSICYWVRKQLAISEDVIPIINRNGFQCLGYQSELFKHV